jgi:cytochrome b561
MERLRVLLAALWAGVLLAVALIATPAAFATLPAAEAGRVAARVLGIEAHLSLGLALLLLLLERRRARDTGGPAMTVEVLLVLGALFCTVAGHFALQPMIEAARAGEGRWSFATLHTVALAFYGLKLLLVLVLAWRGTAAAAARGRA